MQYDIHQGVAKIKSKTKFIYLGLAALVFAAVLALVGGTGSAAPGYTLYGDAEYVSPGNASARAVELSSQGFATFSGIDYDIPAGTTFSSFTTLATDYMFTDGSCGGGSPRFQVNVVDPVSGDEGNIHVYIGPPPNYTLCPPGTWLNTGDLLEGANPIDTTQLNSGAFYDPYTIALTKYGGYNVTGVQLVADGGWSQIGSLQVAQVDNTNLDGVIYTYEVPQPQNKEECKKGGWMSLADNEGNSFKNQGDCVSFVATKGKNPGSGN